jgi:hypothetical protein
VTASAQRDLRPSPVLLAPVLLLVACSQPNGAFDTGHGADTADTDRPDTAGDTTEGSTSRATTSSDGDAGGTSTTSKDDDAEHDHGVTTEASTDDDHGTTEGEADARVVFVTSEKYLGTEIGGLQSADALCVKHAQEAGLSGTFQAWLSDSTGDPATRMNRSGPYVLVDGTPVADDWDALVSGHIDNPIVLDEGGELAFGNDDQVCAGWEVWTNTHADGTQRTDQHCSNWSSTGVSFVGYGSSTDASWTESNCLNVNCISPLPLYCFQQ